MPDPNSSSTPSIDAFSDWLLKFTRQIKLKHQRQVLSLRGDLSWCVERLKALDSIFQDVLIISDQIDDPGTVSLKRVESLLGSEVSVVAVDLFGGINADLLCIASGLIRGGGIMVLLSPEIEDWAQVEDEFGVWQDNARAETPVFVEHLFDSLEQDPLAGYTLHQDGALPELIDLPRAKPAELISGQTPEQSLLLDDIDQWIEGRDQSIALIEADRGRGKSTALGFIVRRLKRQYKKDVIVTAHSRQAAAILLQQAKTDADPLSEFAFMAPDRLIVEHNPADVLVIDEAAMLPYSILHQLCSRYDRVIMATTTGGYEGTGQGFLLRFIGRLPVERLSRFELSAPVRWSEGDRLEHWMNKTFLLKIPSRLNGSGNLAEPLLNCRVISREQLAGDKELFTAVYALLVSAHYRTRPSDLRQLLENPDLTVILAESSDTPVGVILLNQEGGLSDNLCEQVFLGMRRPKGHLLAQMITAQAGDRKFAQKRGMRIQRIAVDQCWRRKGIGSDLISAAIRFCRDHKFDYLGASYAFEAEAAAFWHSCEFALVHVGFGVGKSSGNHSVAMLYSLNPGVVKSIQTLRLRIQKQLPIWLSQFLKTMDVDSVVALLVYSGFDSELSAMERDEVDAFVYGHKGFELCFASLQGFVMQSISSKSEVQAYHPWLIEKVVQNRDWVGLQPFPPLAGRRKIQQKLRELIGDLRSQRDLEDN